MLTGTLALHNELEQEIAQFKQTDGAAVFSSGYSANLSLFSCLCNQDDVIICDRFAHQSIIDGVTLSKAQLVYFHHNNMESLEECLQANEGKNMLVAVDGVYSMDGDIANLPEIIPLCKKYGAALMVDEAHSIGVIGKTGHGVEEHFDLPPDAIDIKMGTISKAIPSVGGYVAANADITYALKYTSKAFLFSAAASPMATAAALESLRILQAEPERVEKLQSNTERYRKSLQDMGYNTLNSETAIVPVIVEKDIPRTAVLCWKMLQEDVFAAGVIYPAVPKDLPRLRTVTTAAFTDEDVDYALNALEKCGKSMKLI
jgi:glycine C-acetyltransferase